MPSRKFRKPIPPAPVRDKKPLPPCELCDAPQIEDGVHLVCKRGHKILHPTRRGKKGGRQQRMNPAERRLYRKERDAKT